MFHLFFSQHITLILFITYMLMLMLKQTHVWTLVQSSATFLKCNSFFFSFFGCACNHLDCKIAWVEFKFSRIELKCFPKCKQEARSLLLVDYSWFNEVVSGKRFGKGLTILYPSSKGVCFSISMYIANKHMLSRLYSNNSSEKWIDIQL